MGFLSDISRDALRLCAMALAASAIWLASLQYVFPGWVDPFWPSHSDTYIAVANSHAPDWFFGAVTSVRPMTSVIYMSLGRLGPQGITVVAYLIFLANILVTAALARRVFEVERSLPYIVAFLVFAALLVLQPFQYGMVPYDGAASLAQLFLATSLFFMVSGQSLALVWAACLIGFFCKETYFATAAVMFAANVLWKRDRRAWLGAAGVAASILCVSIFNWSERSPFTQGGGEGAPYSMDLSLGSVASLWSRLVFDGFNWAHLILLGVIVGAVAMGVRPRWLTLARISAFVAAGLLALAPNAIFPNHYSSGYSFEASYWLCAVVFALPKVAAPALRWTAIGIAIAVLAVQPWLTKTQHVAAQWSLEQQQRQAKMWRGLQAAALQLPPSATRVLVSGINFPFSPFDHSRSLSELGVPTRLRFDVINYGPEKQDTGLAPLATFVSVDAPINIERYDRIWMLGNSGEMIAALDPTSANLGVPLADVVKYPALLPLAPTGRAANWHDNMQIGLALSGYGVTGLAETYLRKSAATSDGNPYPDFYLGSLLEQAGRLTEAKEAYAEAVAREVSSPNPAFREALGRVSQPAAPN